MDITAAFVKEQSVTFAVVMVKPYVVNSVGQAQDFMRSLRSIRDFQYIPLVLAAQNGGQIQYRGRDDIVRFLSNVPFSALPWATYRI